MSLSDRMFWRHYRAPPVGITVYKLTDDSYTQTEPDEADVAFVYRGGYEHLITSAEATALTVAGYGSNIT